MLKKEVKGIVNNPAYGIVILLPLVLTFIMSEGTKNYLLPHASTGETLQVAKEIVLYHGTILDAKIQFAVSELNFMLMMCAVPTGLNLLEERRTHVWDRVVGKKNFVFTKFLVHYGFALFMVLVNVVGFRWLFGIRIPIGSVLVFFSVPVLSLLFGLFVGLTVNTRAMVSNTVLVVVMLMGYFGGAWSLTSVLENTKVMNLLMYVSPITTANKLIFKDLLRIHFGSSLLLWLTLVMVLSALFLSLIKRRIDHGAVV